MRTIAVGYVVLYVMHLILGPYFPWRLLWGQKVRYVKSLGELLNRSVYITYLNMLLIAYFAENPDIEMFVISMISSLVALVAFVYKWWELDWSRTNMYEGTIDHVLYFVIPLIYLYVKYDLKLSEYTPGVRTGVFVIFLLMYKACETRVYKGGRDI